MAQLKDTVIAGSLRATEGVYTNEIQCTKLKALTSASATTNYGVGDDGQILMSNGTNAYWSSEVPVAESNKTGGIKLGYSTTYDNANDSLNVKVASSAYGAYVSVPSFTTTTRTLGLVPKPGSGDSGKFLRGDGTWQTVSTSGTTTAELTVATTSAVGGIQLYSSTETIAESNGYRLRLDSSSHKAYVVVPAVPTFTGTTAGLVPASSSAETTKFLRSDGNWVTIDTSGSGSGSGSGTTSISAATDLALGGIRLYASGESVPNSGYKLSLDSTYNKAYVVIPKADEGVTGLVSASTQKISGKKTFLGGLEIGDEDNTNPSLHTYDIYGAGEITGLLTIHTDFIQITNSDQNSAYYLNKPYITAIQIGNETGSTPPSILISEYFPTHLQIRAQSLLLGTNTTSNYLPYSTSTTYNKDAIIWKEGTFYRCKNDNITGQWSSSNWTELKKIGVMCDNNFIPLIPDKHTLGDSTNSWNALYLNGYKIQCTANGLTITQV